MISTIRLEATFWFILKYFQCFPFYYEYLITYIIFRKTFLLNNGAISSNCGGSKGSDGHEHCPSPIIGSGWVLVG